MKERTVYQFYISKSKKDAHIVSLGLKEYFKKYFKALALIPGKKLKLLIIIDDTDVPLDTKREELKEKILQRIYEILSKYNMYKFSVILILVTELVDMLRERNVELFSYLREGLNIYDTGFFLPLKILVKEVKLKPTKEYSDKLIFIGSEMFGIAKGLITTRLMEDLFRGVVAATQALLGELGYRMASPKECIEFAREILWKKENVISEEDAKVVEDVVKAWKKLEHGEVKEYHGKEFKELLDKSEAYVKKVNEIIKKLREEKGETGLYDFFKKLKG